MKKNKLSILIGLSLGTVAMLSGCNDTDKASVSSDAAVDAPVADVETVVDQTAETTKGTDEVAVVEGQEETVVETKADVEVKESVPSPKELESNIVIKEGVHYDVLDQDLTLAPYDGVTISEFFWLGCPHCQRFEPLAHSWKDYLNDVGINTIIDKNAVPGSDKNGINDDHRWTFDARVYFTMRELGATDEQVSNMLLLYGGYASKTRSYPPVSDIKNFFEAVKLDGDKAVELLNSDLITEKLKHSDEEYNKTAASGVPVFVVNGKYKVRFDEVKSQDDILSILVQLSQKK